MSGKELCDGQRLLHLFDPMSKDYFASIWNKYPHSFDDDSYAFVKGRRREIAIVILRCARWRMRAKSISSLTACWDARNAYPSVIFNRIAEFLFDELDDEDAWLLTCRQMRSYVYISDAEDQAALLRFLTSMRQGDTPAPPLYVRTVDPLVTEQRKQSSDITDELFLHFVDPCTGTPASAEVVKYADDVARVGPVLDPEFAINKISKWNVSLDEAWEKVGIVQNRDKLQLMVEWNGQASKKLAKEFEALFHQQFHKPPLTSVKHLGAYSQIYGNLEIDIRHRIQQANTAWQLQRRFWSSKASLTHRCRVYRSAVRATLISGLELDPLSIELLNRLEVFQNKRLRVLLRGEARGRTNESIRLQLKCPSIASILQAKRCHTWQAILEDPSNCFVQARAVLLGSTCDGDAPQLQNGKPTPEANPWVKLLWRDLLTIAEKRPALNNTFKCCGILGVAFDDNFSGFRSASLLSASSPADSFISSRPMPRKTQPTWQQDLGHAVCVNICPWCRRSFTTAKIARKHIRRAELRDGRPVCPATSSRHPIKIEVRKPRKLACRICSQSFQVVYELLDHIVEHYDATEEHYNGSSPTSSSSSSTSTTSTCSSSDTSDSIEAFGSKSTNPICWPQNQTNHGSVASEFLSGNQGEQRKKPNSVKEGKTNSGSLASTPRGHSSSGSGKFEVQAVGHGWVLSHRLLQNSTPKGARQSHRDDNSNKRHGSKPCSCSFMELSDHGASCRSRSPGFPSKKVLTKYSKEATNIEEHVRACRVVISFDKKKVLVTYWVRDLAPVEKALQDVLVSIGGEIKHDPAPPMQRERSVIDDLQICLGGKGYKGAGKSASSRTVI